MAEERLINVNIVITAIRKTMRGLRQESLAYQVFERFISALNHVPTADAVPVEQHVELQERYIELREQYDNLFTKFHDLRDDFVSYVCDNTGNPAPYCKNMCGLCVDNYGYCKCNDSCKGFNPSKEED